MPLFDGGLKMDGVYLTKEEAEAVFEWLDGLTGCSPENVFVWDGTDSLNDPSISAAYKIFKACKRHVPENLDNHGGDSE
jgi:hypothetical protein